MFKMSAKNIAVVIIEPLVTLVVITLVPHTIFPNIVILLTVANVQL